MIRRILRLFRRPTVTPVDLLIARLATRPHNRSKDGAARFERVHTIPSRGR
jgi:hypothetical protein